MGQSGRGGMGNKKHGASGWKNGVGKSPKLRHALKREAEANERKASKPLPYKSVTEALEKGGNA